MALSPADAFRPMDPEHSIVVVVEPGPHIEKRAVRLMAAGWRRLLFRWWNGYTLLEVLRIYPSGRWATEHKMRILGSRVVITDGLVQIPGFDRGAKKMRVTHCNLEWSHIRTDHYIAMLDDSFAYRHGPGFLRKQGQIKEIEVYRMGHLEESKEWRTAHGEAWKWGELPGRPVPPPGRFTRHMRHTSELTVEQVFESVDHDWYQKYELYATGAEAWTRGTKDGRVRWNGFFRGSGRVPMQLRPLLMFLGVHPTEPIARLVDSARYVVAAAILASLLLVVAWGIF